MSFTADSASIVLTGFSRATAEFIIRKVRLSDYSFSDYRFPGYDEKLCGTSIHATEDNFFVFGRVLYPPDYFAGYTDIFAMKTDTNGVPINIKYYGYDYADSCGIDCGNMVIGDSCFYISGTKNYLSPMESSQGWLLKFDTNCDTIWTRSYEEVTYGLGNISKTSDGSLITASQHFAMKLDEEGNEIWRRIPGGRFGFTSIVETMSGSYYATGFPFLMKLDSEGHIVWHTDTMMWFTDTIFVFGLFIYLFNEQPILLLYRSVSEESKIFLSLTDSLGFVVNHNYRIKRGWNLISSPVEEELWVMGSFPYVRASDCHYYNPREYRYYNSYSITHGRGYWLFSTVDSSTHIEATIGTIPDLNTTLYPGWNLVGTGTIPIPAEWLDTIPSVIMPIFGFDPDSGGYYAADTLYYGNGYWILSRDSIEVVLP
jgi:hypothetical protein